MSQNFKRRYLREVVERPIDSVKGNSRFCQSVKISDTGIEYKMPSKLDAIKEDNVMAGHRAPEKVEVSVDDARLEWAKRVRGRKE